MVIIYTQRKKIFFSTLFKLDKKNARKTEEKILPLDDLKQGFKKYKTRK
jgi:hypothetical protein